MKFSSTCFWTILALQGLIVKSAYSDEAISIDKYTCQQFIDDISQIADGARLLRASIFIAWSTGYASAFQKEAVRGDAKAFQLIAAAIGDTCKANPNSSALTTIVAKINSLVNNK